MRQKPTIFLRVISRDLTTLPNPQPFYTQPRSSSKQQTTHLTMEPPLPPRPPKSSNQYETNYDAMKSHAEEEGLLSKSDGHIFLAFAMERYREAQAVNGFDQKFQTRWDTDKATWDHFSTCNTTSAIDKLTIRSRRAFSIWRSPSSLDPISNTGSRK